MSRLLLRLALSLVLLSTSCTFNVEKGFTNVNSDPVLFQDAKIQVDNQNWDTAIADFRLMTPAYLNSSREHLFLFASALAGKCGFQFTSFFNAMGSLNVGGASPLFLTLLALYKGQTTNLTVSGATAPALVGDSLSTDYCAWAQQEMDVIKTNFGGWNSDDNLFVLLFSLAKIGIVLHNFADTGDAGTVDLTFDGCQRRIVHAPSTVTGMTDFYTVQLVTGFALFLQNFTSLFPAPAGGDAVCPAPLGTGASTAPYCAFKNLQQTCTTSGLSFCTATTPAAVTTSDILNMRSVLMANSVVPVLGQLGLGIVAGLSSFQDTAVASAGQWNCVPIGLPAGGLVGCCLGTAGAQTYAYP